MSRPDPSATDDGPTVRLVEIEKRFGPVTALAGASLEADRRRVHAVLGENGAGKTTLMNILAGMTAPDAGEIRIDGAPRRLATPRDALAAGIGMVHQHFTLVPRMSVLENVALGVRSASHGLRFPEGEIRARILELSERTGLDVAPDARVSDLGVGARQRVEILKLLFRDPRVLILDEPTSVLAPQEVEQLFEIVRSLAAEGRTVLLIAHKLDEVLAVADRVTVLRNGATVLTAACQDVDAPSLARAMVGRTVAAVKPSPHEPSGEPVARLVDVWVRGARGEDALRGVSLEVRRGEIVGIGGVEGNGQRELAQVLAGRLAPDRGVAEVPAVTGFIPQDRVSEGLILDFSLTENLALALQHDPRYRRGPLIRWRRVADEADAVIERFAVRARDASVAARTLSGGNQQKLVAGRELDRSPSLLVAENPTRGLDIAATAFLHRQLVELLPGPRQRPADNAPDDSDRREEAAGNAPERTSGRRDAPGPPGDETPRSPPPGIVLISTDLDDVLALSDRIFVMVRGSLLEVPPGARTPDGMGELMLSGARGS